MNFLMAATLLQLVQTIPLPDVEGRLDHMAVDVAGHRLFVAALGNNTVEVLDLKAGKHERSVTGFREPQDLAWIEGRNALFVTSGEDAACHVVDGKTYAVTEVPGKIKDADNVRYVGGKVYVGFGDGGIRILDPKDWRVMSEVDLPAHPEGFQVAGNIVVNVPAKHSVAILGVTNIVLREAGNFPLAMTGDGRFFIGCRNPPVLLAFDMKGHKLGSIAIDSDTDDIFYDARAGKLYVSCGAGFIDVIDEHLKVLEKIPTTEGARTSLFVPELKRLYVAVPHRGKQAAEVRVYESEGD